MTPETGQIWSICRRYFSALENILIATIVLTSTLVVLEVTLVT